MSEVLDTKHSSQENYNANLCKEIRCSECDSTDLICDDTRGEIICNNCGIVAKEHIVDMGPEWRSYTAEERNRRSRVGSPTSYTLHDKGLSTTLGYGNRDAYGRKLAPRRRAEIYRMRKWQRRTRAHSSRERNLARALSELDRLASQLGVPNSVREESAVIYRKALEKGISRSTSIDALVAATLYAACRIRKIPRTLDEVAEKSRISKKKLGQTFRLLARRVEVSIPISSPIDYISRFSEELGFSGNVSRKAVHLLKEAKKSGIIAGKSPTGLAAAALYIAGILADERRTQHDIARVANVTEVTVRNRYKELVNNLQISVIA